MATHNVFINPLSLREDPAGAKLLLHLPWYRSLWLSVVDDITVTVDGQELSSDRLTFRLGGTSYRIDELREQTDTLWFLQDVAELTLDLDTPVIVGEHHTVEIRARLTLVYMQIRPELYVPQNVHQTLDLEVLGQDALTSPQPTVHTRDIQPEPAQPDEPFKLGLTLYSATNEMVAGHYNLETLLERVAEQEVGPGIEIVASQMIRSYPIVTDEFEREWRSNFDRFGFEPSSFGANLDFGRLRTRDMNGDEEFEFSEHLLRGAKKLGFPLVRIQSTRRALLERLLPVAEELDLKLGYEIHAPNGPNTPATLEVRELFDELDSPLLGYVADFSSTMHSMAPAMLTALRRRGLDEDAISTLQTIWSKQPDLQQQSGEFVDYLNGRGIDPGLLGPFAHLAFNMNAHWPIAEWQDIMPRIFHVHAKFYDIDDAGTEPAIDYRGLVHEFARGGFAGFMSSEWEGHAFLDVEDADSIALVREQHNLIRRAMHEVTSPTLAS
jgi:sugar phosphate isomerase/epimerase